MQLHGVANPSILPGGSVTFEVKQMPISGAAQEISVMMDTTVFSEIGHTDLFD